MENNSATEQAIIDAINANMDKVGVPRSEFDPQFVVNMIRAMQISHFKYGFVADAYPMKYVASDNVRVRMGKYRETGDKWFLVDAANFAMMEAMHPQPERNAEYMRNDDDTSPGIWAGRRFVKERNDGTPIG